MDIILWRHAEAEETAPDGTDENRRLTAHGQHQATKMAKWLNQYLPKDTKKYASPAIRTQQTAAALGTEFHTDNRLSTSSTVVEHLALIRECCNTSMLIIGHQPTLGQLAALLVCGAAQPWSVKKGAIWWLKANAQDLTSMPAKIKVVLDSPRI